MNNKSLLNDNLKLGRIALKVKDLEATIKFYQDIVGLSLLKKTDNKAVLGVEDKEFIELNENKEYNYPTKAYTGLYHLAILLPTREALGQFLYHISRKNFRLDGAGDHIYSEAVYLRDNEGNGIEVYADRSRDQWKINSDGTIESATNPVDIQGILDEVKVEKWDGLDKGAIVGHVHLQIRDVTKVEETYVNLLGFEIKTLFHNALFLSKNGYHHHIAANPWSRTKEVLPENTTGLIYHTLIVDNFNVIKEALKTRIVKEYETAFFIEDGNGILIRIENASK